MRGEGGIGDRTPAPEPGQQILPGDHAVAILDEIDEEVEHQGLDADLLAGAAQLPRVGIKRMIGKEKLHTPLRATRSKDEGF